MCYFFFMIQLEDIQKRLREAIITSHMSQTEIAKQLGISQSTVSKYLRKNIYPSIDTFANLCKILDISADDILGLNN